MSEQQRPLQAQDKLAVLPLQVRDQRVRIADQLLFEPHPDVPLEEDREGEPGEEERGSDRHDRQRQEPHAQGVPAQGQLSVRK